MLRLDKIHTEEKPESIGNSLYIERQESLEAKISPCLDRARNAVRHFFKNPDYRSI